MAQRTLFHVVMKERTRDALDRLIAAGLTNVNLPRAAYFGFAVVTGYGAPELQAALEALPEVETVQVDGRKDLIRSS